MLASYAVQSYIERTVCAGRTGFNMPNRLDLLRLYNQWRVPLWIFYVGIKPEVCNDSVWLSILAIMGSTM